MLPNQKTTKITKAPTVVLTGGGSGGHITPILSLAQELKRQAPDAKVIYIGLKGDKLDGLQSRYGVFDGVYAVPAGKLRRYHNESLITKLLDLKTLFLNIRDFFRVLRGILASRKLLKQLQPSIVFSKGGFVAVPVGIAAHRAGVPIVTHDSDALPGLANRIIGRWASVHAVGQSDTNYPYPAASVEYTGIPLDERIKPVTAAANKQFRADLNIPAGSLVLLTAGGGLGSQRLNELTLAAAPELFSHFPELFILHICGSKHIDELTEKYKVIEDSEKRLKLLAFTDEFYKYSTVADVIFTRAGATALAEFAVQGKACAVMPAAQLTGGHQIANTKKLQEAGAIELINDEASSQEVTNLLTVLLKDDSKRQKLATVFSHLAEPKAAKKLATIILNNVKKEQGTDGREQA